MSAILRSGGALPGSTAWADMFVVVWCSVKVAEMMAEGN